MSTPADQDHLLEELTALNPVPSSTLEPAHYMQQHKMPASQEGQNAKEGEIQSLKDIAHAIYFLIDNHGELTIKDLSYFLYELVCSTQLGNTLANGHKARKLEVEALREKYSDEKMCCNFTIKNVRRRLYDVLNVMIAAGIIIKSKKTVRLGLEKMPVPHTTPFYQKRDKERLEEIKLKVAQKRLAISKKSRELQELVRKYLQMQKLHERNLEKKKGEIVQLPIVIALCEPGSKLTISQSTISIESSKDIGVWTEMDLLPKLLQIKKAEIETFLKE